MNDNDIKTLRQVRAFLDGTREVEFSLNTRPERYDFVRRTLIRLAFRTLSKPDKGAVLSFLVHVSGYSRIQVKRLAKAWVKHRQLRPGTSAGNGFSRKYTDADRRLLAELDELHETLSGQATKKLCERVPGGNQHSGLESARYSMSIRPILKSLSEKAVAKVSHPFG